MKTMLNIVVVVFIFIPNPYSLIHGCLPELECYITAFAHNMVHINTCMVKKWTVFWTRWRGFSSPTGRTEQKGKTRAPRKKRTADRKDGLLKEKVYVEVGAC